MQFVDRRARGLSRLVGSLFLGLALAGGWHAAVAQEAGTVDPPEGDRGSREGRMPSNDTARAREDSSRVDEENPLAWPVGFSREYHFHRGEVGQITLDWEGIQARRFDLRLDALVPIEVTVTRARDGAILLHACCDAHAEGVIPWGRGEIAHLTIQAHGTLGGQSSPDGIGSIDDRATEGLDFTLAVALDPGETGLEVYSFQVNRFLDLYRRGKLDEARYALDLALREDPSDTTAALLARRMDEERHRHPLEKENP